MGENISRRSILKGLGACTLTAGIPVGFSGCNKTQAAPSMHLARHWEKGKNKVITCTLCPNQCVTSPGETGFCRARTNIDGIYYSPVYANPVALHNDPIEKKPLNHVLPGTKAFSIGLTGCNLRCRHCQNWQISQAKYDSLPSEHKSPQQIIQAAKSAGSQSVAFTYNEPTTFFEYMIDVATQAKKENIGAVIVSNGYINEKPQSELLGVLDAYKVDLKGFTEKFYSSICEAELKHVLDSLVRIKKSGVWLEIVNLVIPTLNDSEKEINEMSSWVVKNLGKDVPIHFTRFHPTYKIRNLPPTPISILERAHDLAVANGIRYAYVGNAPGHKWEHTYCPSCGQTLIKRYMYDTKIVGMKKGKCTKCESAIPGVWKLKG